MRIAVVDDEPKIRKGLTRFLATLPGVTTVENFAMPQDAYQFLQTNHIDLLITDIKMPDQSGLELIQALREHFPDLPVVIVSGYSDFEFAQRAIELGVYRYLTKPTDTEELEAIINTLGASDSTSTLPPVKIVRKVIRYIESNYMNDITLNELAKLVLVTPSHLSRRFSETIGQSPTEYLMQYRLKEAKLLLRNTQELIQEIACRVGYQDAKYFTRVFKRNVGMTPKDYRDKIE